jgi:SPP1 gp7 family putative phage head morphogenesis protein
LKYTDKQINDLLKGIHDGTYTKRKLPKSLYLAIADHLKKAIYEGYGGIPDEFKGIFLDNILDLRVNTYLFSGAKVFQYTKDSFDLLQDSNGVIKSFSKFKADALPIYKEYNVDWLQSEYITTIGQSESAKQWQTIQDTKDVLPYLTYDAILDKNTSDICRPLDGITLHVDHPFWLKYSPLNHFRCRCIRRQASEAEVTNSGKVKDATNISDALMQKVFKSNPGIDGEVFTKDHPYFNIPKEDKQFAKKNFNLPIPKKD